LRDPAAWLAAVGARGQAIDRAEPVTPEDQATEYLLMALRLAEGADLDRHAALAGTPVEPARIDRLIASGHLRRDGARIAATTQGRIVLNTLLAELLA
jgi:oxygen-independent coproporphyrinogen-3 oxidase